MWVSGSGYGKSEMATQLYRLVKANNPGKKVGIGFCFIASLNPVDVNGALYKGTRVYDGREYTVTDPSIPLWMLSTAPCDQPGLPAWAFDIFILVLDEFTQGEVDTKRAFAEVLRNGGTPYFQLPKMNYRLALGNEGGRYGSTKDLDFIVSRRCRLEIHGDPKEWLEYADHPYEWFGKTWLTLPVTKSWVQANPTLLFEPEPKEQGPWCNPRSLCSCDRYTQEATKSNNGVVPLDDPGYIENVNGYLGKASGQSYIGHLKFSIELPSYDQIRLDPDGTPVPERGDLKMLMAYQMAGFVEPQDLANVLKYISRLPDDMAIAFVEALIRRDYNAFFNLDAMQAFVSKNAALLSVHASLSRR